MNKNKPASKFNLIDIILCVLILAIIVISLYTFASNNGVFTKVMYDIEYDICIESINPEFSNNIAVGDIVYDSSNALPIGTVVNIKTSNNDRHSTDLCVTMAATVEEHDGVLSVNGVPIKENNHIYFRTPNLAYSGECRNIVKISIGE